MNFFFSGDLYLSGNDFNLGTGTATTTISGGFGIGVGTTTPGAAFAVATSTDALNTAVLFSNLGAGNTLWIEDEAKDATPFVIDASGAVGIGTTTPGTTLSVQGVANFAAASSTLYGHLNILSLTATSTTATSTFSGGGSFGSLASSAGLTLTGGSLRSSSADLSIFAGGGNDILLNSSGGNVGIGTTGPDATLHVSAASGLLRLSSTGSNDTSIELSSGGEADEDRTFLIGYDASPAGLRFYNYNTSSANLFIQESDGNVGIGTTGPGGKLNIVSGSASTYLLNLDYADTTDGGGFYD